MAADERHAYRLRHAKPVLDEIRGWLDTVLPQVPPNGAVGKALNYLHNEWDKLTRYLDDGRLEIDNNGCENAVRPFVMGRKAWLFSYSVAGVHASANLYSLVETAKAHGLAGTLRLPPRGVHETPWCDDRRRHRSAAAEQYRPLNSGAEILIM
jgi:transposase